MDIENIKKLKEETGAGVLDAKKALEEHKGDYEKAKKDLMDKGLVKAEKKSDRETKDGLIYSYIHAGGKIGSMVQVACETDFVAKTDDFKNLCHAVALQVATGEYGNVEELLKDEYIKDPSKTVQELVKETIAKLGENIEVREFCRLSFR